MKFTVYGEPTAKGRPRFKNMGKYTMTYTDKKTQSYENLVKMSYINSQENIIKFEDTDMLEVVIDAYFSIPKSTSNKKRCLMEDLVIRPIKRPDTDNIAKIILDSLNHIAFKDDSQVIKLEVNKFYSNEPRVEVEINKIDIN